MEEITIKDSGAREEFKTGSVRDIQAGKGRFDLAFERADYQNAIHSEKGAAKYGDRNILKGQPIHVLINSARRHLNKVMTGQLDESHLVAADWNLRAAIETLLLIKEGKLPKELDDLPVSPIPTFYPMGDEIKNSGS